MGLVPFVKTEHIDPSYPHEAKKLLNLFWIFHKNRISSIDLIYYFVFAENLTFRQRDTTNKQKYLSAIDLNCCKIYKQNIFDYFNQDKRSQ